MSKIISHKIYIVLISVLLMLVLASCSKKHSEGDAIEASDLEISDVEATAEDNTQMNAVEDADGNVTQDSKIEEDTNLEEDTDLEENSVIEDEEPEEQIPEEQKEPMISDVDLIMFMGQSNMSGCGGDASLAPSVPQTAGMEYRAISNPETLTPIKEPFGINENNINGIMEKPYGKKGSLVSAFINEYYKDTSIPVIAVSASLGETDLDDWLSPQMSDDALNRFILTKNFLNSNGISIKHMYIVWLQGESDALARISGESYRTKLDDFMRPFFIEGIQKVFIITPGRTIDATEIYTNIINSQKKICMESGYYALATNVLSGVSTEYMTDIYHYNQHVLNMVGIEAAKSVAYYTNTSREMVLYDYKVGTWFVPSGCDDLIEEANPRIELDNINERY